MSSAVTLVSQQYEGIDFNVPSKLMNFMAYGIPTVAAVRVESEVARIIMDSGGGWVANNRDPAALPSILQRALTNPAERHRRGELARAYAARHFAPERFAARFEALLDTALVSAGVRAAA